MDIPIDEVVFFDAISSGSTGVAVDADSTPTFAVYEESTDTDIGVGGNMTKRTSLTGNYRCTFTCSLANGFEVGKWYSVIGSATIGGIACKGIIKNFRAVAAELAAGFPLVDAAKWLGTTIPAPVNAGYVATDMGQALPSAPVANSVGEALFMSDIQGGRFGTAQAGSSSTITLDAGASSTDDRYKNYQVFLYGGTGGGIRGTGQQRTITAYNGTTKVATVDQPWGTNPDSTTKFMLVVEPATNTVLGSVGSVVGAVGSVTGSVGSVTGAVTVDWSATTNKTATIALTNTTISTTQAVASVTGAVGSVTGAVGSVTGNVGGNVTGSVGSISGITFPTNFSSLSIDGSGRTDLGKWIGTAPLALSSQQVQAVVPSSTIVASVTGAVGSVTGAVGSVTGAVTVDWSLTTNKTATIALTNTTISTTQTITSVSGAVGSVTGAVGSVTGNVGGNVNGNVSGNVSGSVGSVTGAVGSVTGAVGSVTGNVGGNVIGTVASVTGAVGSVTGSVGGDVSGKVLGGGSGTISGDGVRASSVTGSVGSVTGSVGSVVGNVGGTVTGLVTSITALYNLSQADLYIDTGVTPWAEVKMSVGTGGIGVGTELLRKRLFSTAGANLTSTDTVVGQAVV